MDMETQILLNIIKQGLEHYDDILRCPHVVMDLAPIFQIRGINFMAPGRKVGKVMADYFKKAAQVRALGQLVWDWEEVDNQEQERVKMEQIGISESDARNFRSLPECSTG